MNTWPNRGASGGPCGGWNNESLNSQKKSDQAGLTQANRPPRNPVRFMLWDSPAFRAGLTKDLTLLAVNLRSYEADVLRDAVTAAAKPGGLPVELLLKDGSDYRIARIDWRGGLRYPALERIDGKADLLTPILSAR